MKKNTSLIWLTLIILVIMLALPSFIIAKAPASPHALVPEPIMIPVLTYHRIIPRTASIYDFTPEMLEKHFKLFKTLGYHPISAVQFLAYLRQPELMPKKPIVLTFDDGNKSHYTRVFPLLKKYGFQATFFVYPRAIKEKSNLCLTWTELKEMNEAGFDIESHSMSHPFLTRSHISNGDNTAYLKWLNNELLCSKALLEYKLAKKITLLAYPYGWFDTIVESAAVQAGYQGLFTVNWGQNSLTENPLRIKRRVMDNTMRLSDIQRYISARPLALEIITPLDAGIVTSLPVIQFRLKNPTLHSITISVRSYKTALNNPDKQGVYTFDKITKLKPGFCMVIIRGYDDRNNYYMGSWGFNYQAPAIKVNPVQTKSSSKTLPK
jgi:peptidoglycan/xylan/chitin deacetylase (PgdA/CDA1 family)